MAKNKRIKVVDQEITHLYDQITKVESQIIDKLVELKKKYTRFPNDCSHFDIHDSL